jgi:CIC family chloride channel protein
MLPDAAGLALWVVLLLPFAKIVATSLSIGSGGSGGIFGPGMVIGGMLGAAVWRLTHGLPGVPAEPAPFVIVGMMALFGSIAHAPLAVMLMVAEMTGNLALLAPAMVAVGIATLLVGDETIYRSQLRSRTDSPAHRFRYSFPLLASLPVRDAMIPVPQPPTPASSVEAAAALLSRLETRGLPVADDAGHLVGVVGPAALTDVPDTALATTRLESVMETISEPLRTDMALDVALDAIAQRAVPWLPVVDEQGQVAGTLSAIALARTYRRAAARGLRPTTRAVPGTHIFQLHVTPASPLIHEPLRTVRLPAETLVASVLRHGEAFIPDDATCIQPGDLVTIVTTMPNTKGLEQELAGIDDVDKKRSPATAPQGRG